MGELPTDLYKRCRDLLSKCDEFESNESVQSVFIGTEIKDYSRYVNEKRKPDDRISEVIRVLQNKSYSGKSVLVLFLDVLGKRYPEGDDTRAELTILARDISYALKNSGTLTSYPLSPKVSAQEIQWNLNLEGEMSKRVLTICSQNEAARIEIFEFLRGANLVPVEWKQIEANLEKSGPSVDEVLSAAFNTVQAVIVVFTGDDLVEPRREFVDKHNPGNTKEPERQPVADLLFKAGVAFGMNPTRTTLVVLGGVRPFHSLLERHLIRLTNSDEDRKEVIAKLKQAHCIVTGYEWAVKGNFHNLAFY